MAWTWRTLESGLVEVDRGLGGNFEPIALAGPDPYTDKTESWARLARPYADAFGVPLSWVLAIIYSESGGQPRVRNACCAGLMALSLAVYKITEDEAFDPDTNVELGVKTLGDYRKKGFQLPQVASMYNAGPSQLTGGPKQSLTSVWGMVENMPAVPWTGYIEKVVRAANWWRARELAGEVFGVATPGGEPPPGPPPLAAGPSGAARAGIALVGAAIGFFSVRAWHARARARARPSRT